MRIKTLLATSLLTGGLMTGSAQAVLMFDIDGPGIAFDPLPLNAFDWLPGQALAVGGAETQVGDTADLTYIAELSDVIFAASTEALPIGAQGPFEITVVVEGEIELTNRIDLNNDGYENFRASQFNSGTMTIYFDSFDGGTINANDLTGNSGDGYADGQVIFEGDLIPVLSSSQFTFLDDTTIVPLDNFGANDMPGINTLLGAGVATLDVEVTDYDPLWFPGTMIPVTSMEIVTLENPFGSINPATAVNGIVPDYGLNNVNGLGFPGSDFHTEADGNQDFRVVQIPEPHFMLLLGAGLIGLAWRLRRSV